MSSSYWDTGQTTLRNCWSKEQILAPKDVFPNLLELSGEQLYWRWVYIMPDTMTPQEFFDALTAARKAEMKLGTKTYIVGSTVRRILLNDKVTDLDLVVDAPGGAGRMALEISSMCEGASEPTIINAYATREVRVKNFPVQISDPEENGEFDTTSLYAPLSKRMKADVLRRDFTVNTLLLPVSSPNPKSLIDPLGIGISDLKRKVLRTPIDPEDTYSDDPIRLLRAIRFFAIDGFSPVSELYAGAAATAHLIAGEPGERISMELSKILLSGRTSESMRMLINFGLMHYIFPDIEHLAGVTQQPEYYTEDALNHTFKVLSLSEPVLRLRLAALFHDVGKARTRQTREGKIVFSGHQYAGAEKTREALKRLRYPRKLVEEVSKLVEMHMIAYRTEWSDTAVRRLVHEAGDLLDDLLLLYRADILARAQPHNDLSIFEHLLERIKLLDLDSIIYAKSPLTGEMIMSVLGVAEGPLVGDAQDAIEQAIVDGKIGADESSAMQLLRKEIAPRLKGNSR